MIRPSFTLLAALALAACTTPPPAPAPPPQTTAQSAAPHDLTRMRPADTPLTLACDRTTTRTMWGRSDEQHDRFTRTIGLVGAADGLARYTVVDGHGGDVSVSADLLAVSLPVGELTLISPGQAEEDATPVRVEGHARGFDGTSVWHADDGGCVRVEVSLDRFTDGAEPAVGSRTITSRWCPGLLEVSRDDTVSGPGGSVSDVIRCAAP